MNTKAGWFWLIAGTVFLFITGYTTSQAQENQIQHQSPPVIERGQEITLTFDVPGLNASNVEDAFLFYRMDGDISFQQRNARLSQSRYAVDLQIGSEAAGAIEYYFEIQLNNGEVLTFPNNLSTRGPVRVDVVEERENQQTSDRPGLDYTILSPEPGEQVAPNDALVAITLFYKEGTIDTSASSFQLYFNDENITEQADASPYFLSYVPEKLSMGTHEASLRLRTGDSEEKIVSWQFSVVDPAVAASVQESSGTQSASGSFIPSGQAELRARNQVVSGNTNDILSGNIRISGREGDIRYSAHGLLTSQEDPRLQPQNRYKVELYVGNWLEFQAGHIYPRLSPLTISGQRIQGINTTFRSFDGAVNFEFIYGKLRRNVSNLYQSIEVSEQEFEGSVVDTTYSLNFQSGGVGTFDRRTVGGRVSFGRGNNFQLGLNAMKIQDDTTSIDIIRNYNDVLEKRPEIASGLSAQDRSKLEGEPNLLGVNGNPRPKGNFIAGSDLALQLDDNRIQFRTDAAVSLLNEDISSGPLNSAAADDLGFSISERTEDFLDRLSWLIIINENMSALPLRFNSGGDQTSTEVFFPASILGTQSELSLNYLDNNLRIKYRWVGPDFNSLATSAIRRDIAGFTVTDRFRLYQNRIYVTLGYENLDDNVVNNLDATTNTATYRGNVSWYPLSQDLPRVSLGIMNRVRDNSVARFNPFIEDPSLENVAIRNYVAEDDTSFIGPNSRNSNTIQVTTSVSQQFSLFGMTQDASINYSLLNTNDRVFGYGDVLSNSFSFNLTNRFATLPLETNLGFNINNTETNSGLTDINIFGFNVGGTMYFLDDDLMINGRLAFTKNKVKAIPLAVHENNTPDETGDDYYEPNSDNRTRTNSNSYIFNASARYNLTQNHAFLVDMRLTNVQNRLSGNQIPNDHILQARYVFNF